MTETTTPTEAATPETEPEVVEVEVQKAWNEFWQKQKKLRKPSERIGMFYAFQCGIKTAVKLINEEN